MSLAQQLGETGVHLKKKIGFIIESRIDADDWAPRCAKIGTVQTEIPDGSHDQEEVQDFDPECDLLVLWAAGELKHLYILRVTDSASVYWIQGGGIIIEKKDVKIHIGQTDAFMDKVCDVMCKLAQ
jgi:hypothetical protein